MKGGSQGNRDRVPIIPPPSSANADFGEDWLLASLDSGAR
jgi:hypothetical protein